MKDNGNDYEYDPIECTDCGERVVVTRKPDAPHDNDGIKFECGCQLGHIAVVKPDSWTGGSFL